MKRSQINKILRDAVSFFEEHHFPLPPFAFWSEAQWKEKGAECDELRRYALGWDITDFGSGDFDACGLLLFTLRNGAPNDPLSRKPYAEKAMICRENQVTPYHYHIYKNEDIINRGGGVLCIQLYNAAEDDSFADTPVQVYSDGREFQIPAGGVLRLLPGESITLYPRLYHQFWAEDAAVFVVEVSMCNDDNADNHFYLPRGRFPVIEEDEPRLYLLGNEYPTAAHE